MRLKNGGKVCEMHDMGLEIGRTCLQEAQIRDWKMGETVCEMHNKGLENGGNCFQDP